MKLFLFIKFVKVKLIISIICKGNMGMRKWIISNISGRDKSDRTFLKGKLTLKFKINILGCLGGGEASAFGSCHDLKVLGWIPTSCSSLLSWDPASPSHSACRSPF